jgi:predicted TIM-barrel fold metal-dependent hydrolase
MPLSEADHYTIISADCHAGASHETYRGYLEARYLDDFDAWREKYRNPFSDLRGNRRLRNWDDDLRNSQLESDGIVGEVVFPNTVPPFFPSFVLFARPPKPSEYEHRLAGIRAHNRWLADWCARFPERRAGIGQIFLNDVDDAIEDVEWISEHGLRGGVLISAVPPDVDYVKPLYDPVYEPLWSACEDLGVKVNSHGGTGLPNYGKYAVADLLYITEVSFYSQRPFVQLLLSGVFERHPRLQFVMTEMGCAWLPPMLERFDQLIEKINATGATGELRYTDEHKLPRPASEYFRQNCWVGVSQPGPDDVRARAVIGTDKFMWGSDYPHDEGTWPFTREHLRQLFHDTDPVELQQLLAGNAARLYDFSLDALAPLAAEFGPTVADLARPLDALPEQPNEALLKAVGGSRL